MKGITSDAASGWKAWCFLAASRPTIRGLVKPQRVGAASREDAVREGPGAAYGGSTREGRGAPVRRGVRVTLGWVVGRVHIASWTAGVGSGGCPACQSVTKWRGPTAGAGGRDPVNSQPALCHPTAVVRQRGRREIPPIGPPATYDRISATHFGPAGIILPSPRWFARWGRRGVRHATTPGHRSGRVIAPTRSPGNLTHGSESVLKAQRLGALRDVVCWGPSSGPCVERRIGWLRVEGNAYPSLGQNGITVRCGTERLTDRSADAGACE
jgi:hypothetical protein